MSLSALHISQNKTVMSGIHGMKTGLEQDGASEPMESLTGSPMVSHMIKSCIEALEKRNRVVPHNQIVLLVSKISEIVSGCEDQSLKQLLSSLKTQAFNLHGVDGVNILVHLLMVIDEKVNYLAQMPLVKQIQRMEPNPEMVLLGIIDILRKDNVDEDETPLVDFDKILCSSNYIAHFVATHNDFSSRVIVVAWKSEKPGPATCHDGMSVLYVHHHSTMGDVSGWCTPSQERENHQEVFKDDLEKTKHVNSIIESHNELLFKSHSNIVSIRCSNILSTSNNKYPCIEFVVLCKNFLPIQDKPFPKEIDGIQTCVSQGWAEYCGKLERGLMRPLKPGAGFAIGKEAHLILDSHGDYTPIALCTIGGFYKSNGVTYGVTCGHCIQRSDEKESFHSKKSPVFQPCAMGEIVTLASTEQMQCFERNKSQSDQFHAITDLNNDLKNDANAHLPENAKCAQVYGHILWTT